MSFEGPPLIAPVEIPWCADSESYDLAGFHDFSSEVIGTENVHKPLWVCPDGHIFMEAFSTIRNNIEGFLIAIAEPVSRPPMVHEFQITVLSLYSAVSVGVTVEDIIANLDRFAKNGCPKKLSDMIRSHGELFGKLKLVLQDGRYFIESPSRDILLEALKVEKIRTARRFHQPISNSTDQAGPSIAAASVAGLLKKDISAKSEPNPNYVNGLVKIENTAIPPPPVRHHLFQKKEVVKTEQQQQQQNQNDLSNTTTADSSTITVPQSNPSMPPVTADPLVKPEQNVNMATNMAALKGFDKGPLTGTFVAPEKEVTATVSFEIHADRLKQVREACLKDLKRPLLEEYDFRIDSLNASINVALKPSTQIRPYQELALRKMFGNGRARSGIIVLPCGAGKTLVGIVAATTLRKSCLVLTSTAVAVEQWRRSFLAFTTINDRLVKTFTADCKDELPDEPCILCSTYTMLAFTGKRSHQADKIVRQIAEREWGLLILDEVQFAPAPQFRRVCDIVRSHCKLGLTATLVREDGLIHDLQWLIGPKLYEAHWLQLQDLGYLAKVQCVEIWCSMAGAYYREYLRAPHIVQRRLWVCNPNKLRVCEFLCRYHDERGDKVIVFSDNLFALVETATRLKKAMIFGQVSIGERMHILQRFQQDPTFNVIFLSRVGDNAVDIPCANVIIQISFNFASRRQEAQRLGRILRPKPRGTDEFNAVFYSLLSRDTQELYYADKRQQFIIDQGYAYQVVRQEQLPMQGTKLIFDDPKTHRDILNSVLRNQSEDFEDVEQVAISDLGEAGGGIASSSSQATNAAGNSAGVGVNRQKIAMSDVVGGGGVKQVTGVMGGSMISGMSSTTSHPLLQSFNKKRKT